MQGGVLYLDNEDKTFYAIDANSGQPKWTFQTDSFFWGHSSPTIMNTAICFLDAGSLFAVDIYLGQKIWSHEFDIGNSPNTTPTTMDGVVFVQSSQFIRSTGNGSEDQILSSKLQAMDAKDGAEKWAYISPNLYNNRSFHILPSPTASNRWVYFGSLDGHLYAIDSITGKRKWSFDTGGPLWGSPCVTTKRGKVHRGLGEIHISK